MDIDGLKTFVAIAELGGFTRAGARLHRSQPAISRRLGLLEQEWARHCSIACAGAPGSPRRATLSALTPRRRWRR